jgi:signal transduction histidine kinase
VRGSGLTNLADRVAAVGGTLRIDSSPGAGTRVTGHVPARSPEESRTAG